MLQEVAQNKTDTVTNVKIIPEVRILWNSIEKRRN